jgi:hypothetical protein
LEKLASRKLWITLLALAGVTLQGTTGADWWQQAIIGALAAAYVLAQAFVDGRGIENPIDEYGDRVIAEAEEVLRALKLGLEKGRESASSGGGDVGELSASAAVDPNLIVLIVQLVEKLLALFKRRK